MYPLIKRVLDFTLALLLSFFLAPLLLAIALWIRIDSPGPVLFRQKRIGIHGSTFDILKFRSMRHDTPHDIPTHLLEDPTRWITPSGAFLRRSSLDELPQLLNILKGEMSFVGPRPALWNQDDLIAARARGKANDIPPGLTGWAQVHGRDELEIEEKAALDNEYAERCSFVFDLRCLWLTVWQVLRQRGIREGKKETKK